MKALIVVLMITVYDTVCYQVIHFLMICNLVLLQGTQYEVSWYLNVHISIEPWCYLRLHTSMWGLMIPQGTHVNMRLDGTSGYECQYEASWYLRIHTSIWGLMTYQGYIHDYEAWWCLRSYLRPDKTSGHIGQKEALIMQRVYFSLSGHISQYVLADSKLT